MLVHKFEGDRFFTTLVDEIFSKKTKQESLDLIDYHSSYWTQFQSGSQGISGKKTVNTMSTLSEWEKLFTVEKQPIEEIEDSDDVMIKVLAE
jgi:hypothetical protein